MSKSRTSMALWFLLAIVVFNVRFDWNTRTANHAFVRSQIFKRQHGLPLQTINEGFRPMARRSAVEAGKWLVLIAMTGTVLTFGASKRNA